MKKVYDTPKVNIVKVLPNLRLLLPASSGGRTGEALAPRQEHEFLNDDWDDYDWEQ